MNDILVSVWMITYNHEKFIEQALDGVLMQQTDFEYEIVIGDDRSIDGTRTLIEAYEKKYPNKIKAIYLETNVGAIANAYEFTLPRCKGKYIACLEGDDYWTDPLKLQKQIDFLEKNPEYSLCSHRLKCYMQNNGTFVDDWMVELFDNGQEYVDIDFSNFFNIWVTQTVTVVFKKDCYDNYDYKKFSYYRDIHLFYNILQKGKGRVLNFYGAVYRAHVKGMWSGVSALSKKKLNLITSRELFENYNNSLLRESYINTLKNYIDVSIRRGNTLSEYNHLLQEIKDKGFGKGIYFKLLSVSLMKRFGLYFIIRLWYKIMRYSIRFKTAHKKLQEKK